MSLKIDGLHDYLVIARIGEGNFSTVYQIQHKTTHQLYALKVFKQKFQRIEDIQQNEEILVLKALGKHQNIVFLHEVIYEPAKFRLSLVLDLMDKNAFEVMSQRNGPLSVFQALQLTYQILSALKYIHSKNIIHRDIKPENCLVNPYNMELKLGDFGSAKDLNQVTELTEYISTRWYRPPECILSHGSYGPGIDIWATGCILYEFLTNYPLFPGKTSIDQINRIHRILGTPTKQTLSKLCPPNKLKTLDFEFIKYPKQKLSKILPKAEPVVLDLLSKLIAYVPSERITADEALKHPAFNILQQCFFKNPNANYSSAPFAQPNSIPSALFNQEKQLKQTIKDDGNVVKMNITKKKDGIQLPQVDVPIKMTRMQQKRVLMKTPPRKSHVHANNKPGEKMILGRHATGTIAFGEKKNEHPKE